MRIINREIINNENQEVELAGWVADRRDHGKLIFIDLRDKSGVSQIVFVPQNFASKDVFENTVGKLRSEWVIAIKGKVKKRPTNMENPDMETGQYEIEATELKILAKAKTLPFEINLNGRELNEEIRMKYRYLDLRRNRMRENLASRNNIIKFIRDFLNKKEFIEIETPVLGKSTPEGARDYLIPSRLHQGKFYALPQSPQQYKQLLMVAGIERYFQIVRCFRDEDTRGDRQPEFTQLDIEMSFIEEEYILNLIETLYLELVKKLYPNKKLKLDADGRIPQISYKEAMEKYNSDKPDIRDDKNNLNELAFVFVVDFPMFEWKETEKRWDAVHHPFTYPKVKDVNDFWTVFKKDPSLIIAKQYDLALNGYEVAGGSIRIHDQELLSAVFEAMGNKPEDVKEKFGHMLEAFQYGVPPHGGIASGLDRLIAILQNEPNIREVIAFPKTGDGRDLMMNAPSEVEEKQLKELGLKVVSNKQ
ncbi:MAG: aspartate--tRNA ligase [Patescibacteria group bacterium]